MISLEKNTRYCFYTSVVVMGIFLTLKILVVLNILPLCNSVMWAEFICFVLFIPLFFKIISDYVKKIYFGRKFNQNVDNLPNNLKYLFFRSSFNQSVDNLPFGVKIIYFEGSFNQPLDFLPNTVKKIILPSSYDKPLDNLPDSVETIIFGYELDCQWKLYNGGTYRFGWKHRFNNIPKKLKKVHICSNYVYLEEMRKKYPLVKFNTTRKKLNIRSEEHTSEL